jgi:hypothetical protein
LRVPLICPIEDRRRLAGGGWTGHGRGLDSILEVREHFEESIGATFAAAVEHMTGRRVIAFLSETHIEPPFSVEFFRLAPRK